MTAPKTCVVCGTVNVVLTGRCIACSQPLAESDPAEPPPAAAGAAPPAAPLGSSTAPLEEGAYAAAAAKAGIAPPPAEAMPSVRTAAVVQPAPASRPAPSPPAPSPPAPPPAPPPEAPNDAARTDEIGGASLRRTVVEPAARRLRPKSAERPPESGRDSRDEVAPNAAREPSEKPAATPQFVLRLLLPEGDKRLVEIGDRPVKVGSGLDEVGLAGDPRVRVSEAVLQVSDGVLWIDVAEDATGVYRRIEGEEPLADGDVVLVGDIAAQVRALPAAAEPAPDRQVLGGGAGTPCWRLVFLRRDGSPGPVHDLPHGKTILGRTDGHINFPSDSRLSRRHARFVANESKATVEDLDSRNGTYVRLRGRRRLSVGDALRVGSAGLQIRAPG